MARRSARTADTPGSDRAVGWATLVLGLAISATLLWKNGGWKYFRCPNPMDFAEYYVFNIAMLLLPPFVMILLCFKRDLSEFGLTPGDVKWGTLGALAGWLAFLPVLLFIGPQKEFQNYYIWQLQQSGAFVAGPLPKGIVDYGRFSYHETVMCFYMLAWEWFFRGFLLQGLRKIMPAWAAALVQALLFGVLHLGKPVEEVASSFVGGLVLAVASLRFRSVLPCFLVHFLISFSFDVAVLFFHFR